MLRILSFLFFAIGIIFFVSCENEIETLDEEALGFRYAPVGIGKYWIYKSDSIVYKLDGADVDSLSGYIKEEITDTLVNAANEKVYRLERSFKRNINDQWGTPRVWTTQKSELNYIRTEENLKFVKLVFPPSLNSTWDGNVFIDPLLKLTIGGEQIEPFKGFWDYTVDSTDLVYQYDSLVLDEVLKIVHVDDEDFLEKRYSEEQYAANVGLVYKKMVILDTQCSPNCAGESFEEYAESGFILELSLIESN